MPRKKSSRAKSRGKSQSKRRLTPAERRAAANWWLGPMIVYMCMLAVLILFTFISPVLNELFSDGMGALINQVCTFVVPIFIIYLHVTRMEKKDKFFPSVGITRNNLRMAIIWGFAMYLVFYMVEGIYWTGVTSAAGTGAQNELSSYLFGEYYIDSYANGTWDPGENFQDLNGNGTWDNGEPFTDSYTNGVWDNWEPFEDVNKNGTWDNWETFQDIYKNGTWDPYENFEDLNGNGVWDDYSENFEDLNGNGVWDEGEPLEDNFPNGVWDAYEPFTDVYANGDWDNSEPFSDWDGNGARGAGFSDDYFLYSLFSAFLIVGLSEELIFRGFITDRLLEKGPFFAITTSALMFAVLHFWYIIEFGLEGLLFYGWLFMLAATWGVVYWKTRNIIGLVLIHGLTNLSVPFAFFFGGIGTSVLQSFLLIVGGACLGYLLLGYIKGMFKDIDTIIGRGTRKI